MSLHIDMLDTEFTEEMTHRVVRYGARSPEAREALRFAKRHPNPRLLKIARFKIAEQERFDVENGLASPWVRVLHFLDEEVFDRLRLNSIGQVAAVTGLVLGIVFLSERTRAWFRNEPASAAMLSERAVKSLQNQSPSAVDLWFQKELARALQSPEVKEQMRSVVIDGFRRGTPTAADSAGIEQVRQQLPIALGAGPCVKQLSDSLASSRQSPQATYRQFCDALAASQLPPDVQGVLLMTFDSPELSEEFTQVLQQLGPPPEVVATQIKLWIESPDVQHALESVASRPHEQPSTPIVPGQDSKMQDEPAATVSQQD